MCYGVQQRLSDKEQERVSLTLKESKTLFNHNHVTTLGRVHHVFCFSLFIIVHI